MKKSLDKMKTEYMQIKPDSAFEERIENLMKEKKKVHRFPFFVGIAAAACICCMVTLNCIPAISVAAQEIPVVKQIVNVLTFGRFEMQDGNIEAEIVTPEIVGLENKALEEQLNNEFKEHADVIKAEFIKEAEALKAEFGDDVHMGLDMDYQVLTDNEKILAIDVYIVNTVGSSSTKHTYYNIDKTNNRLVTLEDLYAGKADWRKKIQEYIRNEMERRNAQEGAMFWTADDSFAADDTRKAIENFSKFYINNEGNTVICFDKYEIAPGAQGSSEFEIPTELVK